MMLARISSTSEMRNSTMRIGEILPQSEKTLIIFVILINIIIGTSYNHLNNLVLSNKESMT